MSSEVETFFPKIIFPRVLAPSIFLSPLLIYVGFFFGDIVISWFIKNEYLFSVNAADNKQRDPKMDCLKIDIDP